MIGQIMYKAYYRELPPAVQTIFLKNENINNYRLRQRPDFYYPRAKTNLIRKTVAFKGVDIWKFARSKLAVDCSLYCFKQRLKNLYLNMDVKIDENTDTE